VAIVLVMYTIYSGTQGSTPVTPPQRSQSAAASPPTSPATMPNILTVAEAAAYMRITEKEVLGLIEDNKLGAARIGDSYRIARIAIENFMTGS
jgi:excisionase family DNA binding protein